MLDKEADVERLRKLLLEHLHVEVPSADADLLEMGLLDSLQLVELLLLVEQHFGRRIPIESIDLESLRSLSRLAQLLAAPPDQTAGGARPVAAHGETEPGSLHGSLRAVGRSVRRSD